MKSLSFLLIYSICFEAAFRHWKDLIAKAPKNAKEESRICTDHLKERLLKSWLRKGMSLNLHFKFILRFHVIELLWRLILIVGCCKECLNIIQNTLLLTLLPLKVITYELKKTYFANFTKAILLLLDLRRIIKKSFLSPIKALRLLG